MWFAGFNKKNFTLNCRTLRNKKATKLGSLELLKKDNELLELLTNQESSKFLPKKKKENSGREPNVKF